MCGRLKNMNPKKYSALSCSLTYISNFIVIVLQKKKYLFNFGSFLNIAGPDLAVPKISPLLGLISINLGPLVLLLTKHTSKPIPKISAMYVDLNVDIPGKSTEIISKSKTSTPLSFVTPVAPSASESPPVDVLHSVPPS